MVQLPINLQYTTIKDPLPEFIYEDLKQFSANANGYKPQPQELISLLAAKHELPADWVFLTAGVDEAIQMFIRGFGTHTVIFTPTYIVYADAEIFGNQMTRINAISEGEYKIPTGHVPAASLLFLANPNNPSGITESKVIIELIENNQDKLVVIDEAYGEFAPELSVISQLQEYKNLAVMKSFSKDYSMAGNRIGYILANPEIIAKVKDLTHWANISYLSVGAAISALNHEDHFKQMRSRIHAERDSFIEFLNKHKFKVLPSKINAVLIQFENEAEGQKFYDYLASEQVTTSHGNGNSNQGLDKSFVRVAIGTSEQMEYLREIISKYAK